MTVYLWHLPLLAAMSGLLLLTDIPRPAGGTAAWWWSRPIVLLAVVALLLPVLALFGRLEGHPASPLQSRASPAAVGTAAVVVFLPIADAAAGGITPGLLGGGAACFALAVLLLGGAGTRAAAPGTRNGPGRPLPHPPLSANVEP
jgi:hypothetical protein